MASQAAISLENARLYRELGDALESQVNLARANARFVPSQFLSVFGHSSISEVQLGDAVDRHLTILFSDIYGFTALSEDMSTSETVGFLNDYLAHMERVVHAHGGFIDAFIGDAIMALFEGPSDGAVRAAVEMFHALRSYNDERARAGLAPVAMGVGLNTGPVTMATVGGEDRLSCSAFGDAVNVASRVEGLTRTHEVAVLITEQTVSALEDPGAWGLTEVGRVTVKGTSEAVTLFSVDDAESSNPES